MPLIFSQIMILQIKLIIINMNKKNIEQLSANYTNISEAKTIIQKLNHQVPVLDVLLALSTDALQQVVTLSNHPKVQIYPIINNQFQKLILNQQETDYSSNHPNQKYSFMHYKKCPYAQLLSVKRNPSILRKDSSYNSNENISNSNLSMKKSKIKSQLPRQLHILKQQLLHLPSVYNLKKEEFSLRKNSKLRTQPIGQIQLSRLSKCQPSNIYRHKRIFTNPQEVINYYSPNKINKSQDIQGQTISNPRINKILPKKYSLNQERTNRNQKSQIQLLKTMIKLSEQKKLYRQKKMTSLIQEKKIKNLSERFNQFMDFKDYPEEKAMRMLDEANKIQRQQQNSIELESLQSKKKDSLGAKFQMLIGWERSNFKKNVKKLAEVKKSHKINLSKIEAIAEKKNKYKESDSNEQNKILISKKQSIIESKIKLEQQCKLLNCKKWYEKNNATIN